MSSSYIPVVQQEKKWTREQGEAGTGRHRAMAEAFAPTVCPTLDPDLWHNVDLQEKLVESSGGGSQRTRDIGGQRTFLFNTTPGLS